MTTPIDTIIAQWRSSQELLSTMTAAEAGVAANRLVKASETFSALDFIDAAGKRFPHNLRLEQMAGLAFANLGSFEQARYRLEQAERLHPHQSPEEFEETRSLLGRVCKSLAMATRGAERTEHALRSLEHYLLAFERSGKYYSAINAATMAMVAGQRNRVEGLAGKAKAAALLALKAQPGADDAYWIHATIAEAELLLGNVTEARRLYESARSWLTSEDGGKIAMMVSTRRNARLIASSGGFSDESPEFTEGWMRSVFPVPRVAICSGHMIDMPDRDEPRFPASAESLVAAAIDRWVAANAVRFGFASAACGADLLFHEAIEHYGGDSHVILPFSRDKFTFTSVARTADDRWVPRYSNTLKKAKELYEATQEPFANLLPFFDYGNQLATGFAMLKAAELEDPPLAVAVWDGKSGDGRFGTADAVELWKARGLEPHVIRLDQLAHSHSSVEVRTERPPQLRRAPSLPPVDTEIRVCGIIFGDIERFSQLSDRQSYEVQRWYSSTVGRVLKHCRETPLVRESRGDGFYVVFEDVLVAGRQAIEISKAIAESTPPTFADGRAPRLRLSLHAGPLFKLYDAILERETWSGPAASIGARIEAVTAPSTVYCSREFAALTRTLGGKDVMCEMVGQFVLPKNLNRKTLYRVRSGEHVP